MLATPESSRSTIANGRHIRRSRCPLVVVLFYSARIVPVVVVVAVVGPHWQPVVPHPPLGMFARIRVGPVVGFDEDVPTACGGPVSMKRRNCRCRRHFCCCCCHRPLDDSTQHYYYCCWQKRGNSPFVCFPLLLVLAQNFVVVVVDHSKMPGAQRW